MHRLMQRGDVQWSLPQPRFSTGISFLRDELTNGILRVRLGGAMKDREPDVVLGVHVRAQLREEKLRSSRLFFCAAIASGASS